MLENEEIEIIDREAAILPRRRSACITALKVVQRHRGWVSDEGVRDIAEHLGMSAADVESVATFYNLIFRRPVGRHVIFLCDSVSCWIMGCDRVRRTLRERLGVDFGGTSDDGRFTLLPIQCLGVCDHAPALLVDEEVHWDLGADRLDERLDEVLEEVE